MSGLTARPRRPVEILVAADGTGDYTSLPAALAAVPAGGATVQLKRGTYVGAVTVPAKTTLRGEGMGNTILQAPISTSLNVVTIGGADVVLEDLQIDGVKASQTDNGTESTQCGVYLPAGAHRCRLIRCYIHDVCGMGVSNILRSDDLSVDACRIINPSQAASLVQATPAPTTTTFRVGPGMGSKFSAGQSLRIGTQTATVASVVAVSARVAAVASTSVFTLEAGFGPYFSAGQVLRIGPQTGTISTVVGDVVTLTGALAARPIIGQIVARDDITLTAPITLPVAGQLVAVTGTSQKGIYCKLACARPIIRNSYLSGWSQAIGIWYGVFDALIQGNSLVDNYGYEDTVHVTARSALELYPNDNPGGRSRVIGNLIDGSTHNCIECAQGELAPVFEANTLKNWAAEAGLGSGGGVGLEITGQSSTPGSTDEVRVANNTFESNGSAPSVGVSVGGYARGAIIIGNAFRYFSGDNSAIPVNLGGDNPAQVRNNVFAYCFRCVFVNTTGAGGQISGNRCRSLQGTNGNAIQLSAAGNGWLILGNSLDLAGTASEACTGINIGNSGGGQHRMIGNYIHNSGSGACIQVQTADNLVFGNTLDNGDPGNTAPLILTGAGALRNLCTGNYLHSSTNRYCAAINAGADYNQIQENTLDNNLGGIITSSPGAHNQTEPNHLNGNGGTAVLKTMALKQLGSQTVGTSPVTVAHGLGYAPTVVVITMTSAGTIWKSAAADATNITLTADSAGRTAEVGVR